MKQCITLLLIFLGVQLYSQDFRKNNWGDSPAKVKEVESASLNSGKSTKDKLLYVSTLGGKNVEVVYKFADDKLVRARYEFIEQYADNNEYYSDYMHFKTLLSKKYGDPSSYEQNWRNDTYKHDVGRIGAALKQGHVMILETWEVDKTEIAHAVYGSNGKIHHVIEYVSKELKHLEEQEKEDAGLDDL